MTFCKAIILVSAVLLVTCLRKRINQVNTQSPHQQLEAMTDHAGDNSMKKTRQPMVEQGQEEHGEALFEEDAYKGQMGKAEADAADEVVSASVGEDAVAGAQPEEGIEPQARLDVEKVHTSASRKDMERAFKFIPQGKTKQGIAKKGTDKGKGKGRDKGKGVGKDKENRLVIDKFKANRKANGEIGRKLAQRPQRQFWFPVLNGRWWIIRLAFIRGQFTGFIHQEIPASKTLLIKSWKVQEEFGDMAIIPLWDNHVGAKVGDKITFDIGALAQEGEGKPRPMATNIIIRGREHAVGRGLVMGPAPTDVRTQVLYYLSDANLRTDKFFQDIIAGSEDGWISTGYFLLCRRLQNLGASKKSIIEALRGTPGVEVRDTPGQEAVRRTSPPPPLLPGTLAWKDVVWPSLEDSEARKQKYTLEMMKSMGDLPDEETTERRMLGQDQEENAEALGLEAHKNDQTPTVAKAKAEVSQVMQRGATKKGAARSEAHRKWMNKARVEAEEQALEAFRKAIDNKDAAEKAGVEKPTATKALAGARPDLAVDKTMDQNQLAKTVEPEADKRMRAPTMVEAESSDHREERRDWPRKLAQQRQAAKKLAVKHKAEGNTRHAKDMARAEAKEYRAMERAKKAAVGEVAAKKAAAEKPAAKKETVTESRQDPAERSAVEAMAAEVISASKALALERQPLEVRSAVEKVAVEILMAKEALGLAGQAAAAMSATEKAAWEAREKHRMMLQQKGAFAADEILQAAREMSVTEQAAWEAVEKQRMKLQQRGASAANEIAAEQAATERAVEEEVEKAAKEAEKVAEEEEEELRSRLQEKRAAAAAAEVFAAQRAAFQAGKEAVMAPHNKEVEKLRSKLQQKREAAAAAEVFAAQQAVAEQAGKEAVWAPHNKDGRDTMQTEEKTREEAKKAKNAKKRAKMAEKKVRSKATELRQVALDSGADKADADMLLTNDPEELMKLLHALAKVSRAAAKEPATEAEAKEAEDVEFAAEQAIKHQQQRVKEAAASEFAAEQAIKQQQQRQQLLQQMRQQHTQELQQMIDLQEEQLQQLQEQPLQQLQDESAAAAAPVAETAEADDVDGLAATSDNRVSGQSWFSRFLLNGKKTKREQDLDDAKEHQQEMLKKQEMQKKRREYKQMQVAELSVVLQDLDDAKEHQQEMLKKEEMQKKRREHAEMQPNGSPDTSEHVREWREYAEMQEQPPALAQARQPITEQD